MLKKAEPSDAWYSCMRRVRLSANPMSVADHDGWLWAGPEDDHGRKFFWETVKSSRCVVLEGLNAAIIGLVWLRGQPVVAYDATEVTRLLQSRRIVSEEALTAHAEKTDASGLQALMSSNWGQRTPVFRLPDF